MIKVKVKVRGINSSTYFNKIKKLSNDKATMIAVHNAMAKRMDKYVPMGYTGNLSQDLTITENYIQYNVPYAHYMYEGIVYGPNIPIIEDGIVVGFYSIPGKTKSPKKPRQYMVYSQEKHPLATRRWDKAMLKNERKEFFAEVKNIVEERIEKL